MDEPVEPTPEEIFERLNSDDALAVELSEPVRVPIVTSSWSGSALSLVEFPGSQVVRMFAMHEAGGGAAMLNTLNMFKLAVGAENVTAIEFMPYPELADAINQWVLQSQDGLKF